MPSRTSSRSSPPTGSATKAASIFYGHSFICDERGDILAEFGADETGVLTATLDLDAAKRHRAAFGFFRDRRPELYGRLTEDIVIDAASRSLRLDGDAARLGWGEPRIGPARASPHAARRQPALDGSPSPPRRRPRSYRPQLQRPREHRLEHRRVSRRYSGCSASNDSYRSGCGRRAGDARRGGRTWPTAGRRRPHRIVMRDPAERDQHPDVRQRGQRGFVDSAGRSRPRPAAACSAAAGI